MPSNIYKSKPFVAETDAKTFLAIVHSILFERMNRPYFHRLTMEIEPEASLPYPGFRVVVKVKGRAHMGEPTIAYLQGYEAGWRHRRA